MTAPRKPTKAKPSSARDRLRRGKSGADPVALPTGEAFRPEWIDFAHGIRVGNLEPHERITQILKFHLESRYATPIVTDRWGRGVYWQWICWMPRANRLAKTVSQKVSFGCSKLFISADGGRRVFKSGLQVERGYASGPQAAKPWGLRDDFDWDRLLKACRAGTAFEREFRRLVTEEGFAAAVVTGGADGELAEQRFTDIALLRAALRKCPPQRWAGFQLYYPMPESELRACTGYELTQAIARVFDEVVPAMNCCMDILLRPVTRQPAPSPGEKPSRRRSSTR